MMGRHHNVPLGGCHNILIRRRGDAPLRHLGDVPVRRSWNFHLTRRSDVQRVVVTTSPRRLAAGWVLYL